jgi:hypothetical protein
MKTQSRFHLLVAALSLVLALAMLTSAGQAAGAVGSAAPARDCGDTTPCPPGLAHTVEQQAPRTLGRDEDPVIVTGAQMPAYSGVAFHDLFVYKYSGGSWSQIPWQFDEVVSGHITGTVNSSLDAGDQLVFMAGDTGDQAPPDAWIADVDSQRYPRYQIVVTDPLNPAQQGWVYVYRSATDTETVTTDYVNYNGTTWLFTAQRYVLGIIPYRLAAERLEMNGSGVDILDRTKMRVHMPVPATLTEDELELNETPVVKDGRVRAYATLRDPAGMELTLTGYRSTYDFNFWLDLSGQWFSVDWMRLSADLSSAAVGSTYYDANTGAGATVDGVADAVAAMPPTNWWQVSGSTGSVVQIADMSLLGGTRTNYYKDDKTVDPADTGDQVSYADCGSRVENPNQNMRFRLFYYILPANQPNVGAVYGNRALSPLLAQATEQQHETPSNTPTPTATVAPTRTLTATRTATTVPSRTSTATATATTRAAPSRTPTMPPGAEKHVYLPLVMR